MSEPLVHYLACPVCGGDLDLRAQSRDGVHIMTGSLTCLACGAAYAIRGGIPRMCAGIGGVEERTADAFGYEWTRYNELAGHYRKQFLDWIRGFRALVSRVRPGGAVSAWVYGREGNEWIVRIVSPIRERVTSRMPHGVLDLVSAGLAVPLFLGTRVVYGPTKGRLLGIALPYGQYLSYLASFPYREQRSIVFDHLVAPVAHYIPQVEFARWFERAGLEGARIEQHNGNSWRGFARVPAARQAAVRS
jgi:uncharacterized protein YbaR (Trm112 family)